MGEGNTELFIKLYMPKIPYQQTISLKLITMTSPTYAEPLFDKESLVNMINVFSMINFHNEKPRYHANLDRKQPSTQK